MTVVRNVQAVGIRNIRNISLRFAVLAVAILSLAISASAQSLNWEGQTGVFVTPLAYTAASPRTSIGHPVVAYHFLNTGDVIGSYHTASVTVGLASHIEFGYTRAMHQDGSTAGLSPLWSGGFNIVHGKLNFLPENYAKQKWLPAIAAGFVARTSNPNVTGNLVTPASKHDTADYYMVASKTIGEIKAMPVLLNFGYKVTNSSIFGLTGSAPAYKGRAFGAVGFVVKGPSGSTFILATEAAQQIRQIKNLPGVVVPTTLVYALRVVPTSKAKLNLDFGVAQVAGHVGPGVDLNARHQIGFGISYGL